jgi:hypothetical protein
MEEKIMFIKKSVKVFVLVVLVLALSGFTYAFAAANTVPATKAGDGSGAITGYTVSNIHYILDASNPTLIDTVTFELDGTATDVYAKVGTGAWSPLCILTGSVWSCDAQGTAVLPALTLQVVAAN